MREKYLLLLFPNSEDEFELYSPTQIHMNHTNWMKDNWQNTAERYVKYEQSHLRAQSSVLQRAQKTAESKFIAGDILQV